MTLFSDHIFFVNNSSQVLVRWLMAANKKKKKKKTKVELINNFFYPKNETKKAVNKSIELKIYIGPLLPKWQPRPIFWPLTDIRGSWGLIWSLIDLKFSPDFTER